MNRRLVVILILLLISGIALSIAANLLGVFPFDLKVALALRGKDNPVFAAFMMSVSFARGRVGPFGIGLCCRGILCHQE